MSTSEDQRSFLALDAAQPTVAMKREAEKSDANFLTDCIAQAACVVSPVFPPACSVPINPLWDLRSLGFQKAVSLVERILGTNGYPSATAFEEAYLSQRITNADIEWAVAELSWRRQSLDNASLADAEWMESWSRRIDRYFGTAFAKAIDSELDRWCQSYVEGALTRDKEESFFIAWKQHAARDPISIEKFGKAGAASFRKGSRDPLKAIIGALKQIGVDRKNYVSELRAQLARTPIWSGRAKWHTYWTLQECSSPSLELVNLLAVRLSYESALAMCLAEQPRGLPPSAPERDRASDRRLSDILRLDFLLPDNLLEPFKGFSRTERQEIWLSAFEHHFMADLMDQQFEFGCEERKRGCAPNAGNPSQEGPKCRSKQSQKVRKSTGGPRSKLATDTQRFSAMSLQLLEPDPRMDEEPAIADGGAARAGCSKNLERMTALYIGSKNPFVDRAISDHVAFHYYNQAVDPDRRNLEALLRDLLIRAHWCNSSLYFSSLNGDSPRANSDGESEKAHGMLPDGQGVSFRDHIFSSEESLAARGHYEKHTYEAMRLICVIEAAPESIDLILANSQTLREVVDGKWVRLAGFGPSGWTVRVGPESWHPFD